MKKIISVLIFCAVTNLTFAQKLDESGNIISSRYENLKQITSISLKSTKAVAPNIISVIPSPTSTPCDIAFDGKYLWIEGFNELQIYQISPINGSIIKTIPSNVHRPYGLTFDGTYLWLADTDNKIIQQIDTSNGNVIQFFPTPAISSSSYPGGLAWDGQNLWHNDAMELNFNPNDSTYKVNTSGQIIQSYHAFGKSAIGLTWDGQYLWSSNNKTNEIYKIDVAAFSVIDTIDAPGGQYPNGLAFDGQYLWVANSDADSIYQLDIDFVPSRVSNLTSTLNQLSIYPNPSTGIFVLKWNHNSVAEDLSIIVSDPMGKAIIRERFTSISPIIVDLDKYKSGVFFYTIFNKKGTVESGKLIKE